jgi:hypothetical protein
MFRRHERGRSHSLLPCDTSVVVLQMDKNNRMFALFNTCAQTLLKEEPGVRKTFLNGLAAFNKGLNTASKPKKNKKEKTSKTKPLVGRVEKPKKKEKKEKAAAAKKPRAKQAKAATDGRRGKKAADAAFEREMQNKLPAPVDTALADPLSVTHASS